jgi:MoxR-like ATPase
VAASDTLQDYVLRLWQASADPRRCGIRLDDSDDNPVAAGASARGISLCLRAARVAAWLDGRDYLTPADVQDMFHEAIAHRIVFQPVYELQRAHFARRLTEQLLQRVPAP